MTYIHLTTNELIIIEDYFDQYPKIAYVLNKVKRCRQTIYKLFAIGKTALDYYNQYQLNKKNVNDAQLFYQWYKQNMSKSGPAKVEKLM